MEVGRIFVCQPSYSGHVPASHKQFWVGGARPGDKCWNRLDLCQEGGSLLADCFNKFWDAALNRQLAGEDITHFAMLHDDVVPQDSWVEQLLSDLAEYDADVCSVVVPIKNPNGLTSTAIDDPTDGYLVERRITLAELECLPEVFTAEDCGYPGRALLCNTGCWIARLDKPWRFKVKFEIRNRKQWCRHDGKRFEIEEILTEDGTAIKPEYLPGGFVSDVDPEDWNFSRQLFRLGAKAVATKRVKLTHQGQIPYSNYPGSQGQWGTWFYDQVFAQKFGGVPITAPVKEQTDDLREILGWMTKEEGQFLAELAKGKEVLEIGSYCGKSTIWMARTANRVTAVDTFKADGTFLRGRSTLEQFKENLARYDVTNKVDIRVQFSSDGVGDGEFYDVAFIDGSHNYQAVLKDFEVCVRALKPGGIIAFHDYANGLDVDVDRAVGEILGNPVWQRLDQRGSVIAIKHDPAVKLIPIEIKEHSNGKNREPETAGHTSAPVAAPAEAVGAV